MNRRTRMSECEVAGGITSRSPSPRPSPLGRGRGMRTCAVVCTCVARSPRHLDPLEGRLSAFAPCAFDQSTALACCSLSPRERVRVRGKRADARQRPLSFLSYHYYATKTPTALHHSAQGCASDALPWECVRPTSATLKGLHQMRANGCNPFRVEHISFPPPRVATASQPWAERWNPGGILFAHPTRSIRASQRFFTTLSPIS